ncbi:SMC-Scp complex subunit ScpB [Rhizosaccharibacter radicis]|uniref:SMC-Scp complex subunit ScpB n=1 Tax=Rhizosaccharibacter radicis TaxID=2782605 RepID=A0ABT1VXE6_9PROT|nr:SMC-Scp complex subunit ScpB [Acetobacteraceae bacterium KSS12]
MTGVVAAEEQAREAAALVCRLVEAAVFASSEPVSEQVLVELLLGQKLLGPDAGPLDAVSAVRDALASLAQACGDRGIRLVEVAGGWQFRTAPDLAPMLTKVLQRPRRLSRVAMETLAIVAYHQPCTRTDIETIRGVSLSQQTLDALLESGLIVPKGRKEVPGRPTLWGTSQAFLKHFGLRDLRELPRREELLVEVPVLDDGTANDPRSVEALPADALPG